MMRKLVVGLLFFSIVTGSLPMVTGASEDRPLVVTGQNVNSEVVKTFASSKRQVHRIVFAESREGYSTLVNSYEVIEAFPNLRAAIVNVHLGEVPGIEQEIGMSFATGVQMLRISVPPLRAQSLGMDAVEDAEIMQVDKLWDLGYSGQNVTIGMVDNGIEEDHPGLEGRIINQTWFELPNVGKRNPFHGTPVAGTMVANGKEVPEVLGTAYNASIMAASWRMTDDGFFATGPDDILFYETWDYMLSLNQTVKLINYSGGSPYWGPMSKIFERFDEAGVLVVASAGNTGSNSYTIQCPACFLSPLGVGAISRDGKLTRFSSRGPSPFPALKPDVVAVGDSVYTTTMGGTYYRWSGTSFSSPLTAGAIATLISALNAENISWNAGSLKAAVIRGAFMDSQRMDNNRGAGVVNIYNSYLYLKSQNRSFANGLAVTPLKSDLFDLQYFPDVAESLDGFTVVTSNSSDINFSLDGNVSTIVSLNLSRWRTDRYSQFIPLELNTSGVASGIYTGVVNVSLGDETLSVDLKIEVLQSPVGKVLVDLRHSDGDLYGWTGYDGIGTRNMIREFMRKGYKVEFSEENLTLSHLSKYDVLWLSIPFMISMKEYSNFTEGEVQAVHQFVEGGGSVLVNYHGIQDLPGWGRYGADPEQINRLTEHWGIRAETDPAEAPQSQLQLSLLNLSSIVGGAATVLFEGNFIDVNQSQASSTGGYLHALTFGGNRTTLVTYDKAGAGRVLVSSSELWLSNAALLGETESAPSVGKNVVNWLTQEERLSIVSEDRNGDLLTLVIKSPSPPSVTRIENQFVEGKQLSVTDNGDGTYTLEYPLTDDGVNELLIVAGSNYLRQFINVDILGPRISPLTENNTEFRQEDEFVFLKFKIEDPFYSVKAEDITTLLDGEEPDPVLFPTLLSDSVFQIKLSLNNLSLGEHNLEIRARDNVGNVGNIVFVFSIHSDTSTESTSAQSTETSMTSSSSEKSPLVVLPLTVALIALPVLKRRRHSKDSDHRS